jgi:hypothetical protein
VNAALVGAKSLADGRQHTIRCSKTAKALTITIDGTKPKTKQITGGLGSITNTASLALGAKAEQKATSGFDWFKGELFDAWVGTGS